MEAEAQVTSMPRIGDKAPSFKAVTTQGEIQFPDQYAGSWVILFSHPADFTPVCTSEFMTFATLEKQFEELDCKLVGLSVDGLYSHIAWLRTIKEKIEYKGMKNVEVKFPLIEDITMDVAHKYGMIQPGESSTKAVRAVFVIDPKGTIRTILYYPLSLGRNFPGRLAPRRRGHRPHRRLVRRGQGAHGEQGHEVLRLVLLHEAHRQGPSPGRGEEEVGHLRTPPCHAHEPAGRRADHPWRPIGMSVTGGA